MAAPHRNSATAPSKPNSPRWRVILAFRDPVDLASGKSRITIVQVKKVSRRHSGWINTVASDKMGIFTVPSKTARDAGKVRP